MKVTWHEYVAEEARESALLAAPVASKSLGQHIWDVSGSLVSASFSFVVVMIQSVQCTIPLLLYSFCCMEPSCPKAAKMSTHF